MSDDLQKLVQLLEQTPLTLLELAHFQSILADRTLSAIEKLPTTFRIPE
jgi:hypothetical protein